MVNTTPQVSVIVCVYNGEKTLIPCIESLAKQTYSHDAFEIVIVNDGSKDSSAEICREFLQRYSGQNPNLTYIYQDNAGLSMARNAGIHFAKGQIIAFIDQDAVAESNWLKNLIAVFGSDDSVGAVGGNVEVLNSQNRFAGFIHRVHYDQSLYQTKGHLPVIGTNMAYRRHLFSEVGGFFEVFTYRGDESAFMVKVYDHYGIAMAYDAVVYHEHPETMRQWLKERIQNGKFTWWVHEIKRLHDNTIPKPLNFHFVSRSISLFLGSLAIIMIATRKFLTVFWGLLMLLPLVARLFRGRRVFNLLRTMRFHYGAGSLFSFPLAILLTMIGNIAADFGFLKAVWTDKIENASDSIEDSAKRVEDILTNMPVNESCNVQ